MTTIPVAMAVYNGEKYIKEQIDSILVQLGENDEMIISYLGGMKRFVLGGGYDQDDGIYQYKVCLALKAIVEILSKEYQVKILTSDYDHIKKTAIEKKQKICSYIHVLDIKRTYL